MSDAKQYGTNTRQSIEDLASILTATIGIRDSKVGLSSASRSGQLKLDTSTLGFSDIQGRDQEKSHYVNVGGSYGASSGSTLQDSSQVGKGDGGLDGWSLEGHQYTKDREQIVRATVGAGEVVVRIDASTGGDSTAGLNRDVSRGYEITKDEEKRTDLYLTKSSVEAVASPQETMKRWQDDAENYGRHSVENQRAFQINRPDETVFFGLLPKTDTVSDLPVFRR